MAGFDDPAFAARFRDWTTRIIKEILQTERPGPTYAQVKSIDRGTRSCTVQFPGDTSPVGPIPMGAVQPASIDQWVKVEGPPQDRYVTDVLGPAVVAGLSSQAIISGFLGHNGYYGSSFANVLMHRQLSGLGVQPFQVTMPKAGKIVGLSWLGFYAPSQGGMRITVAKRNLPGDALAATAATVLWNAGVQMYATGFSVAFPAGAQLAIWASAEPNGTQFQTAGTYGYGEGSILVEFDA